MKNVLIFSLLLVSCALNAQKYSSAPNTQAKYVRADSGFILPADTITSTVNTNDSCRRLAKVNDTIYIYSCVENKWKAVGSIPPKTLDTVYLSGTNLVLHRFDGTEYSISLDIYTASHGLTKTGIDIKLGGTFGDDFTDVIVQGNNSTNLFLRSTSGVNYSTDNKISEVAIGEGFVQMQEQNRTNGRNETFSHTYDGVSMNGTGNKTFTSDNGAAISRLEIKPDSVMITSPLINMNGSVRFINRNNTTEDSSLIIDANGLVKQKKIIGLVDTVLTVSALQAYTGRANLVLVKDTLRGGLFMSKGAGIVDNGITFTGVTGYWSRVGVNNNAANILWYGAIPNDGVNDNAAVTAAIATRRAVYVPDGTFLITVSQTLSDNQSIFGNGISSVLQTTTANNIQIINVGNYGTVRDLLFLGSGKGSTTKYVSLNGTQIAVRVLSKSRVSVSNCTFQNMGGAGFYCQTTANVSHEGSTVINCQADSCFNGFYSGTGGEYINYVACRAYKCDYGATFLGGNNRFNSGLLDNCQTGIRVISDRGNDAHGEVVGSTINHCYDYSISIDSTLNSFLFSHNMIYYGKINIKKVVNGVRFIGNDIASTDTIFVNSATNVQFEGNAFISTLPQLMKNWNGTSNTNPVTSDVTMFNNRYINVVPYSQITHPQNQLLGGVNIYGNSIHWGNNTGILNTSFSTFQESDGTRVGYIGDAASFDNKMYIVTLNGRDLRFGGLAGDGSMIPVTMNAVYSSDGFFAYNDSLIDRSAYLPRFRITGGAMRSDSLLVATNSPTNRTHIVGSIRFQSGLPCLNCLWTDTTGTGVGAWKPAPTAPHPSPGTVTFTPVASPDTYFGTGYSINISGDGDHFKLTINTGTGISATGTLGHFTLPAGFAATPVTVWSGGTVTTNATNIGFGINATSPTDLIMFNSSQFIPSATYIYNIISGL